MRFLASHAVPPVRYGDFPTIPASRECPRRIQALPAEVFSSFVSALRFCASRASSRKYSLAVLYPPSDTSDSMKPFIASGREIFIVAIFCSSDCNYSPPPTPPYSRRGESSSLPLLTKEGVGGVVNSYLRFISDQYLANFVKLCQTEIEQQRPKNRGELWRGNG